MSYFTSCTSNSTAKVTPKNQGRYLICVKFFSSSIQYRFNCLVGLQPGNKTFELMSDGLHVYSGEEPYCYQRRSGKVNDLINRSPSLMNADNKPVADQSTMMLGDLIAKLDNPDLTRQVLTTLDPEISESINRRAKSLSMSPAGYSAAAVKEFVDWADEEQWAQLLTYMKKADDPGLRAVQAILCWVATADNK